MKWCGIVGYAVTKEIEPGYYEEQCESRKYFGDVIQSNRRLMNSSEINDSVSISNQISIVSDAYANEHIYAIRYCEFMGTKWKVDDAKVEFPRIILTLGGVYNGA